MFFLHQSRPHQWWKSKYEMRQLVDSPSHIIITKFTSSLRCSRQDFGRQLISGSRHSRKSMYKNSRETTQMIKITTTCRGRLITRITRCAQSDYGPVRINSVGWVGGRYNRNARYPGKVLKQSPILNQLTSNGGTGT